MPWAEPVTGGRWRNNIHNAIDPAGVTEDVTQRVTLTHAAVTRAASLPWAPSQLFHVNVTIIGDNYDGTGPSRRILCIVT